MLFNVVLDTLADIFQKEAKGRTWGIKLGDGSSVNLILSADNYWLSAAKAERSKP